MDRGTCRRPAPCFPTAHRSLLMDWVCLVYMAVVGLCVVIFRHNVPGWHRDAAAHLVIVLAIVGLIHLARTHPRSLGIQLSRTLYPLLCCSYGWVELDKLIPMVGGSYWATRFLARADLLLFRVHPNLWVQHLYTPWLDEIMSGFYLSYYFFAPVVCVVFIIRRRYEDLRAVVSLVTLSCLTTLSVFYILPALSPRMWPGMTGWYTTDYKGYFLGWVTRAIQSKGAIRGGCFPSSHVTGAVIWTLAAWRYDRSLGRLLVPLTIGVAAATVYLRYHYAVDALAGLLLASACYAVGVKLLRGRGEDRPDLTPTIGESGVERGWRMPRDA